jgi:hypothetical protein
VLAPARGGHAGRLHDLLGERLGALQPGGGGRWAEGGDAGRADAVGQAVDQRRLGADDDEVDALGAGDGQRLAVDDPGVAGDARVAGRGQQLGVLGGAAQRAHERVLAAAGADDEDLHGVGTESCRGAPLRGRR